MVLPLPLDAASTIPTSTRPSGSGTASKGVPPGTVSTPVWSASLVATAEADDELSCATGGDQFRYTLHRQSWDRPPDSCRARHFNLFGQRQRQSVRIGRRGQPDSHDLGPATVIRS